MLPRSVSREAQKIGKRGSLSFFQTRSSRSSIPSALRVKRSWSIQWPNSAVRYGRRVGCQGLAGPSHNAHFADTMDIPVLHLVNRFWIGGAERQFVERLRVHPEGFSAVVGCLEPSGPMLQQVRALGYEPLVFPLKGSVLQANTAVQMARLVALIRERGV